MNVPRIRFESSVIGADGGTGVRAARAARVDCVDLTPETFADVDGPLEPRVWISSSNHQEQQESYEGQIQ